MRVATPPRNLVKLLVSSRLPLGQEPPGSAGFIVSELYLATSSFRAHVDILLRSIIVVLRLYMQTWPRLGLHT